MGLGLMNDLGVILTVAPVPLMSCNKKENGFGSIMGFFVRYHLVY